MIGRYQLLAVAAAALSLAGAASAENAGTPNAGSLCNAQGKVEVLGEKVDVACGEDARGEMKALSHAKAQYDSGNFIGAEKRAMIEARIDARIRELRDELHHSGS